MEQEDSQRDLTRTINMGSLRPVSDQLSLLLDKTSQEERDVINALGEGAINVCGEGGDIAAGDLIVTSSTPGKGMRQADDIVRSYTVAKAREAVTFSDPSEVRTAACIFLCG